MKEKSDKSKLPKRQSRQTDPIRAAIDYGIDISMLTDNLKRSCTERLIRHQIALNMVEKLRKARRP